MSKLISAINKQTNNTFTENGAKAKRSTLNPCVDLFYTIGASRGKNIIPHFANAHQSNQDVAIRIALWARDVRGGAGERQHFRNILNALAINDYKTAIKLIPKVPEIGRWDDLLCLADTPAEKEAFDYILAALKDGNGLAAKWMPRKGNVAHKLRKHFGLTPRQYRKMIVGLTNVVETKMCANEWTSIEYSKVPSLASARYQRAFDRHDSEGYTQFKVSLEKGETKVNAAAVYPYDVLLSLKKGDVRVANQMWEALPDHVPEGKSFLPVVDVSASMICSATKSLSCMDVAISLGLYLSERNKSVFKDSFLTFSRNPRLVTVSGPLSTRVFQTKAADWEMNTDIEAVFDLVLRTAVRNKLSNDDMPDSIIILSDMQFDPTRDRGTALNMIKRKYKEAGYRIPNVVFWNLRDAGNKPTVATKEGVAMVSGFSPSVMKSLLKGEEISPEKTMLDTVMNPRYNW